MISTTLPRSEFADISAIDMGEGHPLVFLHGVGLRAEAWQPQMDALKSRFRIIAPDMPGHCISVTPMMDMVLADYVRAVLPVLEALDEPALVIGHSMGAMIALELARVSPADICAVAALNAIYRRSPKASAAVKARANSLNGIANPDPRETLERWFGDAPSPERTACEAWLQEVDPKGYQSAYKAFADADGPSRSALQALDCPALFMTGGLEPNSTPEMSQSMAKLAPQGRALIVEGAAHMMPMTHAREVNVAVLALAKEIWS